MSEIIPVGAETSGIGRVLRDELGRWKRGTATANPGGRPGRPALVRLAALEAVAERVGEDGRTRLENGARAIVQKFERGDVSAATWVRDTIDGLPVRRDDSDARSLSVEIAVLGPGGADEARELERVSIVTQSPPASEGPKQQDS